MLFFKMAIAVQNIMSMFAAVSDQGTNRIKFAIGFFVSTCLHSAKIIGCSNLSFLLHLCGSSLVGEREANSLFRIVTSNFIEQ